MGLSVEKLYKFIKENHLWYNSNKNGGFMNKQQLANKIWESANNMRSKIEANEYKDYILGFILSLVRLVQ
mgnify:CR=1 FL=1